MYIRTRETHSPPGVSEFDFNYPMIGLARPAPALLLGQLRMNATVYPVVVSSGFNSPAPGGASNLDGALGLSFGHRPAHSVIVGDLLRSGSFQIYRWNPAAPLPAAPQPVVEFNSSPNSTVSAIVHHGNLAYFPSNPFAPGPRWVQIPNLREFYLLNPPEQATHRAHWIDRLVRARVGYTAAQLARFSVPALRLLVAHHAAAVIPVRTIRRGSPLIDVGGDAHGVTRPILRYPISEPECYLPVIAETEGYLETINAWDRGAGISIGPIQFNANGFNVTVGVLFSFLWNLWGTDRFLFNQELGVPLSWSMQWDVNHPDLVINAGTAGAVTLHGRSSNADATRNIGFFQSGVAGGVGLDPSFRRRVAARFRNILVWPHVQELVTQESVTWLSTGLAIIHSPVEGVPALNPAAPDQDTFVLKAMLLSAYVRAPACMRPLLFRLRRWATPAAKLAHWQTALNGTSATCQTLLRARLMRQRIVAVRVHGVIQSALRRQAGGS